MSENPNNNNILCSHTKSFKEYNINKISYSYCELCGNISIKHDDHFYYTIKPKYKQKKIEINPVISTLNMKKNQNISYPNLKNIYNLNINDSIENIRELKNKISIYFQKRGLILVYLKNITRTLNYSDLSFYHCLFLVDLYLSHNITQEMTDEELLYLLVGFFLVASKFKESDIFEPKFEKFNQIESNITLSKEKIGLYEKQCLIYLNYNFFNYSTYEWLNSFMSNGYIFEGEINDDNNVNVNEKINDIYNHTYKLLVTITPRNIFIKFSPIYMAMTLIEITREEKIDKNRINLQCFKRLLVMYNIEYDDYIKCYKQTKALLNKDNNTTKIKNLKIGATAVQTPQKKKEGNNLEYIEYYKGYRSCEKNGNNRTINKTKKELLDVNKYSRLKIKQKLKNSKIKLDLYNTGPKKTNKKFHSIIVNNNFGNSKIYNFNKNRKNIEIVEFIGSLPNIYNMEANKTFKTEGQTISGRNFKVVKSKNSILNSFPLQNKLLKNREGSSADNKNMNVNTINEISDTSPLKFNILMRNGTVDSFEDNKRISKLLYKSNLKNHKENNSIIINNNSDNSGQKNFIDFENNKFNNNQNNKNVNYIINSYLGNSNKLNKKNNNNNNIYKNFSNIYNNNLKSLFRQSASDYISNNDIVTTLREEKPFIVNNNTKDISIINNKMKPNSKMKDGLENINISIEKEINNIIIDQNKKSFLSNVKQEKNNINTFNNLLTVKKMVFKNSVLPKIKIKLKK
jgi:hypothetical protein